MLSPFPNPLPDEMLFSIYCRYHALSGNKGAEETRWQLTGHGAEGFQRRPATTLVELYERLPREIFPTYEELLRSYTLYPYFLIVGRSGVLPRNLAADSDAWKAVFPEVRIDHAKTWFSKRKFCPRCVVDDTNQYGVAYWHRNHQSDECVICCKHRCRLVWTCPVCGSAYRVNNELYLPSLTCPEGHTIDPQSSVFTHNILDVEILTAHWCENLLSVNKVIGKNGAQRPAYWNLMRKKGWDWDTVDGQMTHRGKHYVLMQIRKFWGLERCRRLPLAQCHLFPASNAPCLHDSITVNDISTDMYWQRSYNKEFSWLTNLWIIGYLLGGVERIEQQSYDLRCFG